MGGSRITVDNNLRSVGERIEALVAELAALGDPVARAKAEEVLELITRFYGAGIERILEIVDEEPDEGAERLFGRFTDDSLVASLMLLHGLHPLDAETRIRAALERVRTHGADATLVEVVDGVARINVAPNSNGRGPSAEAVRQAIEQAVQGAAPEVSRVDLDGLGPDAPPPLIQLTVAPQARSKRPLEAVPTV